MGVFVVARGHAPPALKSAEAVLHGIYDVARLVSLQVVALRVRAPGPSGNDDLNALPRSLGAAGINIIGPVSDQAG